MGAQINFMGKDGVGPLVDGLNRRLDKMEANLGDVAKQQKVTTREAEALWKKAMSPLDRYNDTMRKARALLDNTAEGQRKHAAVAAMANAKLREQQSFFGASAAGKLASYAAGMMGVQAAVSTVTRALREAAAARDELAGVQREGGAATSQLAQVAAGVKGGLPALTQMSRQMRLRHGLGETQASDLLFSLASAGAIGERQFAGQLVGRGAFRDAPGIIKSAAAFKQNFPGRNLTLERSTDIMVAAAKENPATTQELGKALGPVTQLAGKAGLSPEEVAAAVATLATGTTSPEIAATQVRGIISRQIAEPQLQGMSLVEMAQMAAGMDATQLRGLFPDIRAMTGIGALSGDPAGLASFANRIRGSAGVSRAVSGLPASVPSLEASFQARRARQQELISSERLGVGAHQAQAAIDRVQAEAAALGEGGVLASSRQTGAQWFGNVARMFTDDPETVAGAARVGAYGLSGSAVGAAGVGESRLSEILRGIEANTGRGDIQTVEQ